MLSFYNTLTRKIQKFEPLVSGAVTIYTCGPTVYDFAHIGNLSAYLFADFLKRYLRYSGFSVKDAMNLTDVDDKTIRAAKNSHLPLANCTQKFIDALFVDFAKLKINRPEIVCRATENVQSIIDLIGILMAKGFAYQAPDQSVYFRISAFKDYGRFARLDRSALRENAAGRIERDEYDKENASDFALWKAWDESDGEVKWESPWGAGRPGWHIECSAMSMKYLGTTLDIHTGAEDLIFPHHENEIAESEAATGRPFVRYWLHRAFIKVNGEKMAKSKGNFYILDDILQKNIHPLAFRYFIVSNHYRLPLNFSFEALEAAENSLRAIWSFLDRLNEVKDTKNEKSAGKISNLIEKARAEMKKYLDADLNAPRAVSVIFALMKNVNKLIDKNNLNQADAELVLSFFREIDEVWACFFPEKEIAPELKEKIERLVAERNKLRAAGDFAGADLLRAELTKLGVKIEDKKEGTSWRI
jgi:cysteinyl-tRNA synthetase